METLNTPKHPTPIGYHYHTPPTHFGLDVWRGPTRVHKETLKYRSTWPRMSPPCLLCLPHAYSHSQLSDIAKGLCYLHSCNVIHGDLKGVRRCFKFRFTTLLTFSQPNILVDNSGNARIADFGLATVTQSLESVHSTSRQQGHTPRWTAPEVLSGGAHSKEADIFSFAMVMIEVCHG